MRIYQLRFVSCVFRVIFSFVHFISLYTLGGLHVFRKPLPYNMYLFNLRIANPINKDKEDADDDDGDDNNDDDYYDRC